MNFDLSPNFVTVFRYAFQCNLLLLWILVIIEIMIALIVVVY